MQEESLLHYTLTPEDEGKKLEQILLRRFHFSRKLMQKIKNGENAWLDGIFVYLNTRGHAGQTLTVNTVEEEFSTIQGEDSPLEILYEDSLFLALNKPPGQTVHPNSRYHSGTLANAVVGYWEKKNESRPFRPISRIDRNTSGIVLVGKTRHAHQQLAFQSSKNKVEKRYFGIVEGHFPSDRGMIDLPIGLQPGSKIIREINQNGQSAITHYTVIKRLEHYTWMEFTLVTGRTHQIRVHCQASGHPLLGDDLYGGHTQVIQRQALHCHLYSFTHPLHHKQIQVTAPLPHDMFSLIQHH